MQKKQAADRVQKKQDFMSGFIDLILKNKNVMFVNSTNCSSAQLFTLRKELRKIDATMIFGKKTIMKKALIDANNKQKDAAFSVILDQLYGHTSTQKPKAPSRASRKTTKTLMAKDKLYDPSIVHGLILTNGDCAEIKQLIDANVR